MKENSQEVTEKDIIEEEKDTQEETAAVEEKSAEPSKTEDGESNTEEKAAELMLKMKDKIKKSEEEAAKLKDLLMRRQADFENYKKQAARQTEMNRRMLIKDIAIDVISINDNLIRASEAAVHVPEGENLEDAHKSYVEGVMMISKSIEEMLGKYGIEEIDAQDQSFDPNVHEAVEIAMSQDVKADTVTKVFQKGFRLDEFVLRTSKVCVTRPMPKVAEEGQSEETEESSEAEQSEEKSE